MAFEAARAFAHVRALSFPRLSSTSGEEKAGEYIIAQLRSCGLEPREHPFTYSIFPYAVVLRVSVLLQACLLLVGILQSEARPWLAASLALLLLGLTLSSTRWGKLFEAAYDVGPRRKSRNIYVRLPAEGPGPNLIFLAHYDSKSQTMPIVMRVLFYILFYAGVVSLAVAILAFLAAGHGAVIREMFLGAGMIVSLLSLPIVLNFTGNKSPGALDNASGAGIVLELARCLGGKIPPGIDVTFVFTGAEEMGLAGAIRFGQQFGASYHGRETLCLCYDGAGAEGKLRLTTSYGVPPVRTSRELVKLALSFCRRAGIACGETYLPVGAGLEQTPIAHRGFDVLTVHSGRLGHPLFAVHSPGDLPENLHLASLENCGKLGESIPVLLAERKNQSGDHARI
jgi:hypothetical protein